MERSDCTKMLFQVKNNGFIKHINPDIEGSMTKAIIDSSKVLKLIPAETHHPERHEKATAVEIGNINPNSEGSKILLEICKFQGRDVNILDMFEMFKTILKKLPNPEKKGVKELEEEFQEQFLESLKELKFMGYLSQTKQSPFIFKKNYFGKARHAKVMVKTQEQAEQENRDIQRQFGMHAFK